VVATPVNVVAVTHVYASLIGDVNVAIAIAVSDIAPVAIPRVKDYFVLVVVVFCFHDYLLVICCWIYLFVFLEI
jgi:hypothetical protein